MVWLCCCIVCLFVCVGCRERSIICLISIHHEQQQQQLPYVLPHLVVTAPVTHLEHEEQAILVHPFPPQRGRRLRYYCCAVVLSCGESGRMEMDGGMKSTRSSAWLDCPRPSGRSNGLGGSVIHSLFFSRLLFGSCFYAVWLSLLLCVCSSSLCSLFCVCSAVVLGSTFYSVLYRFPYTIYSVLRM